MKTISCSLCHRYPKIKNCTQWETRMTSRTTMEDLMAMPYEELLRKLALQRRKGPKKRLHEPKRGLMCPRVFKTNSEHPRFKRQGCPWDSLTCFYAASEGHLEVLQWARSQGCRIEKVRNRVAQSLQQIRLNNLYYNCNCINQPPLNYF